MNISVAGTGYVGLVAGVCFAEMGHKVVCVDIDQAKIDMLNNGISPIFEPNLEEMLQRNTKNNSLSFTTDYSDAYKNANAIFIGVGTPEQDDGSANLSYIATVARQIAESIESDCLVVVKSTVPIGTNDKVEQFIHDFLAPHKRKAKNNRGIHIEVASNPEFLAQGSAIHDTLKASRIVIGTESSWAERILLQIYEPFNLPIVSVNRRTAEMIKYASNVFLALKLSYMNDIANLCELVGADIQDVAKGMSFDDRIGAKFLNAGVGFGGSCFPKDTKALSFIARQNGYCLRTVEAAIGVNQDQKVILFNKASKRLISFVNLKVAVLGLTFKPGTDDSREAPSIDNIERLLLQGANVYAYDPVGIPNFKTRYPEGKVYRGSITYVDSIEKALEMANVCFIFTEWSRIRQIPPKLFTSLMRTPLVYDGRNIFSTKKMKRLHIEYHSIGRN